MTNLPFISILTTEVAMRIDRKCQKGICTYVMKWPSDLPL